MWSGQEHVVESLDPHHILCRGFMPQHLTRLLYCRKPPFPPLTLCTQEYKLLAQLVNVAGVPGLDFNLPIIGKYVLFHNGVLAARDFLMGGPGRVAFNWKHYKELRAALSKANRT